MGRSCHGDYQKREQDQEEEEEEEALSFCDLPIKEKQHLILNKDSIQTEQPHHEDFDFNHWPPPPPPPPMSAADDLFFQGHMLPLRLSFSSENTHNIHFHRNLSIRSESMDHTMLRFRNMSSSSSSSRSHYSRSSSISNNSISNNPTSWKPRSEKNVFHSHPSPRPQIRSLSTSGHRNRSRSRWDFFRLGLLRTPGIMELQDLKNRTNTNTTAAQKTTGSFLGVVSCKRSVETISATAKSRSNWIENGKGNNGIGEKVMGELLKQKVLNIEMKEKEKEKKKEKEKESEGREERRLSHRRTFEWLKQLSHANFGDEP